MKKLLLMIVLGLVFVIGCNKSSKFNVNIEQGGEVPTFTLVDLKGNKYSSKDLMGNGKKTLFTVVAEWCPHCKEEMPHIQELYEKNKDKVNVVVVFSNVQSSGDAVEKYIKENGYDLPMYYDEDGSITQGFNVEGFPFNLKIDGNKVEKQITDLPVTYQKLEREFSQ